MKPVAKVVVNTAKSLLRLEISLTFGPVAAPASGVTVEVGKERLSPGKNLLATSFHSPVEGPKD
jgi:hypothetical protein